MRFITILSDFIGKSAAQYRKYLERENAKARQEAKQQAAAMAYRQAYQALPLVVEIFYRALQNSAQTISAHVPRIPDKLLNAPPVKVFDNGIAVFSLTFYHEHTDPNQRLMQTTLQREIENDCYLRGIPTLHCRVRVLENYRVQTALFWPPEK